MAAQSRLLYLAVGCNPAMHLQRDYLVRSQLRVIIADRDASSRSALGLLLKSQADVELVGEASDLVIELTVFVHGEAI